MVIDSETYKLTDKNYHKEIYDKKQIIIGHTYRKDMLHYASWINRINGKNKKTAAFTVTKEGKIYQHYNPIYWSSFIDKEEQDKISISIVLENLGWFKKDSMIDKYVDWLGNSHKKNTENVLMKRWRNHVFWDKYTEIQTEALKNLILELCKTHNISKKFIGHNVFEDTVDLFNGIVFRSNYYQESTDISPAFDKEILKTI